MATNKDIIGTSNRKCQGGFPLMQNDIFCWSHILVLILSIFLAFFFFFFFLGGGGGGGGLGGGGGGWGGV